MQAINKIILGLLVITALISNGFSQTSYSVSTKGSDLTIYGTSSLHDWEIVAKKMQGKCSVVLKDGKIEAVKKLKFSVEVDGLKSGKSGMDDNTNKALDADKYPLIEYSLDNVERTAPSKDQVSTIIVTKGTLTVAGFSKEIDLKVAGKPNTDGSLQFIGTTVFNMTDYQIDPPTAVFGTILTGDEITIVFKIVFF